jgi:hypothetical protein
MGGRQAFYSLLMEDVMSRYLSPWVVTVIGLLVAGGLGFAYETDRSSASTLVFLLILTLTAGVVAVIFLKKMSHPAEVVEQMLYKADHPTRT